MLQAVSTARDTQRQLAALRLQVIELTEQAQQLKLQEEVVVTRVRGEAALATTIMQEEAQVSEINAVFSFGFSSMFWGRNVLWPRRPGLALLRRI